jgi:hypothetical protein
MTKSYFGYQVKMFLKFFSTVKTIIYFFEYHTIFCTVCCVLSRPLLHLGALLPHEHFVTLLIILLRPVKVLLSVTIDCHPSIIYLPLFICLLSFGATSGIISTISKI